MELNKNFERIAMDAKDSLLKDTNNEYFAIDANEAMI
jgi:hypothetical protein